MGSEIGSRYILVNIFNVLTIWIYNDLKIPPNLTNVKIKILSFKQGLFSKDTHSIKLVNNSLMLFQFLTRLTFLLKLFFFSVDLDFNSHVERQKAGIQCWTLSNFGQILLVWVLSIVFFISELTYVKTAWIKIKKNLLFQRLTLESLLLNWNDCNQAVRWIDSIKTPPFTLKAW